MTGIKHDEGKLRLAQVLRGFATALEAVAEVGDQGIDEYGLDNWKQLDDALNRYADAGARHRLEMDKHGWDAVDSYSGNLHAAHAAWNSLALLSFIIENDKQEEIAE